MLTRHSRNLQAVLIVLITSYSARPTLPRLVPLVALLGSLAYALASPSLVPAATLSFLQTLTIPISLSSKVPQIVENYKAKSTGQLSAFLVVNSLAGCVAIARTLCLRDKLTRRYRSP